MLGQTHGPSVVERGLLLPLGFKRSLQVGHLAIEVTDIVIPLRYHDVVGCVGRGEGPSQEPVEDLVYARVAEGERLVAGRKDDQRQLDTTKDG